MKPSIFHDAPATREAMEQAVGPRFGSLFTPDPMVGVYSVVLFFNDSKNVTGGALRRGLKKRDPGANALLVGREFTLEARDLAASAGCDVLSRGEFGWTDADYISIRNNLHRR